MEPIKKIVEQLPSKFLVQSTSISRLRDILEKGELSLYSGSLTTPVVVGCVAKIKSAFPQLPGEFYDVFASRVVDNEFCDERLTDAVNFVIDNCIYPQPTIANFISYDRTVKFKTHEQMCKEDLWSSHVAVKFPDMPKVVWVFANDVERYKLTKYVVI